LRAAVILLVIGGSAAAAQGKGRYHDGAYAGEAIPTPWGTVQVKALIHDGALGDVQFMQFPTHRRRSVEISEWSMPILKSEAIREQSAQVDLVSSATITTDGFQQSLASALKRATQ
jgi:uncharacterized protein with FMN-binding domain